MMTYITIDETKKKFLDDNFNCDGTNITTLNKIETLLEITISNNKFKKFIVLDYDLFKDKKIALQQIRQFQKKYNNDFIIFSNDFNQQDIEFFKANEFYNILPKQDKKIMQDILDKKVNYEYSYGNVEEQDQLEEQLCIFNSDIVNISVTCIEESLIYNTFLFTINLSNYLNALDVNVYTIEHNSNYTQELEEYNYLKPFENYYINSETENNICYSIEDIPFKAVEKINGFYINNYGYYEDKQPIKSDLNIILTDSSMENLNRIKEFEIDDNTYVLLINPIAEQNEYIKSLDIKNLMPIQQISTYNSILNFSIFRKCFEEKIIQFL